MATEDYIKTAADGIATKCIERIKALGNFEESRDGCRKTARIAFRCASIDIFVTCPADQQDPDANCVGFREFVNGFDAKANKIID